MQILLYEEIHSVLNINQHNCARFQLLLHCSVGKKSRQVYCSGALLEPSLFPDLNTVPMKDAHIIISETEPIQLNILHILFFSNEFY